MFKISDFKASEPICADKLKTMRFESAHMAKIDSLKALSGRLPVKDEMFFLETTNSFNTFTFITYILKEKLIIDELFIATYSINTRILNSLQNWINNGVIKHITVYISDSIKHRMPKVADMLDSFQSAYSFFTLQYAWTHKKIICVRCSNDYYVIEGSGNFSENSAEEQCLFTNNKSLYEFRRPGTCK